MRERQSEQDREIDIARKIVYKRLAILKRSDEAPVYGKRSWRFPSRSYLGYLTDIAHNRYAMVYGESV